MPALMPERAERMVLRELAALREAVRVHRKVMMGHGEIVVPIVEIVVPVVGQGMEIVGRRVSQVILRRHVAKTRAVTSTMEHGVDRGAITVGEMRRAAVEVRVAMTSKMRDTRTA